MSRLPKNVTDTLARNLELEQAQAHTRAMAREKVKSDWYTRDYQRTQQALAGGRSSNPLVPPHDMHDAGTLTGIAAVKKLREARLRELYERETLAFEAELASKGLALVKPRD